MKYIDYLASQRGILGTLLCVLLGFCGILAHSPFHIWPVAFVLFAVLFRLLHLSETPLHAFRIGLFVGLGYFMGQIYWIGEAFIARGPEFVPVMPPMIFGLAFILSLFWAAAAWFYRRFKFAVKYPYGVLAGCFFLAEALRGHVLGGFPWNLPGYIFEAGGVMSQSANVIGIYGLSVLVFCVSALLARALFLQKWGSLVFACAFLMLNMVYGWQRLENADLKYVDGVKLRIVSVPFAQKDKMDFENPQKAFHIAQEHISVTGSAGLEDITHVIWPEGVVDGVAIENMELRQAVGDTFRYFDDTPPLWIMNSLRVENPDGYFDWDTSLFFNTSFALSFENSGVGEIVASNDKRKLVPFGEFIPGGQFVEDLGAKIISSSIGSISPAPEKTLVDFPGLPSGSPQICYEVIFSGLTPRISGVKTGWILNQSNDAWFGSGVGPYQHANIARYRAIEERVPLIRSAANGLSGVVDPYGRYLKVSDILSPGAIDSLLPQPLGESLPHSHFTRLFILIISLIILIPQMTLATQGGATLNKKINRL